MLSFCAFPTESLRLLVLAALLLFEIVWITKKNRRAALIMAAGTALDLGTSLVLPMMEIGGLYAMSKQDSPALSILAILTIPMLARLTMAFHLLALLIGLVLLVRELPEEERESSW